MECFLNVCDAVQMNKCLMLSTEVKQSGKWCRDLVEPAVSPCNYHQTWTKLIGPKQNLKVWCNAWSHLNMVMWNCSFSPYRLLKVFFFSGQSLYCVVMSIAADLTCNVCQYHLWYIFYFFKVTQYCMHHWYVFFFLKLNLETGQRR